MIMFEKQVTPQLLYQLPLNFKFDRFSDRVTDYYLIQLALD